MEVSQKGRYTFIAIHSETLLTPPFVAVKMSTCSVTLQERALAAIKAEEADRLAALKALQIAQVQADAERQRIEREARIIAAAERQQALLRAERLEAEQAAASQAAAEQEALDAEIARLRSRTPLEVLQDEMAEMKRQMASRPAPMLLDDEREAFYSELTARFKSSKEELATARREIAELKKQMDTLFSGRFILRPAGNPDGAFCGNGETLRWRPSDGPHSLALDPRYRTMAHWQIERV